MEYEVGADEGVSAAVVRAASAVSGRRPDSLRPLYRVVDPDALDALFEDRYGGDPRTGGRLSFIYSGCRITVDNGEYITIERLEAVQPVRGDRGPRSVDLQ